MIKTLCDICGGEIVYGKPQYMLSVTMERTDTNNGVIWTYDLCQHCKSEMVEYLRQRVKERDDGEVSV